MGLQEGGRWLNRLTQAEDLRVDAGVAAPLWLTAGVGGLPERGRVTGADIVTAEEVAVVDDPRPKRVGTRFPSPPPPPHFPIPPLPPLGMGPPLALASFPLFLP